MEGKKLDHLAVSRMINYIQPLSDNELGLQSGVSQIRHVQPFSDHADAGNKTPRPLETIVPSYSIDIESPKKGAPAESQPEPPLPPPLPSSEQSEAFNAPHYLPEVACHSLELFGPTCARACTLCSHLSSCQVQRWDSLPSKPSSPLLKSWKKSESRNQCKLVCGNL